MENELELVKLTEPVDRMYEFSKQADQLIVVVIVLLKVLFCLFPCLMLDQGSPEVILLICGCNFSLSRKYLLHVLYTIPQND